MTITLPELTDPLTSLPGYVLRRASVAALAKLNERLESLALRHTDVAFLMLIEANPGVSQSEAGRQLDIQRANMVPLVARLERRGLIRRRRIDGRTQGLQLARAGVALMPRVRGIIAASEAALIEHVPARLRRHVLPVLVALWRSSAS
jgi:DNA-binding MarR family transcriptional regulator